MKVENLKEKQNARPHVIFDALCYEPDADGSLQPKRRLVQIFLDTSSGTFYHFQRYATKTGWVYQSHANLDLKNEDHNSINNYINSVGSAVKAIVEKQGIAAKAEARAKAKDGER